MYQADPRLIFDEKILAEMESDLQVIINNAASVDFDLRIDEAIQINYYGP